MKPMTAPAPELTSIAGPTNILRMVWAVGPRRFLGVWQYEAGANGSNHAARKVETLR